MLKNPNHNSKSQITLHTFHTVRLSNISKIHTSKQSKAKKAKLCENGELSRTPNRECVEVQTISLRHSSLSFSFPPSLFFLHFSLPRFPPPPPRKSPYYLSLDLNFFPEKQLDFYVFEFAQAYKLKHGYGTKFSKK